MPSARYKVPCAAGGKLETVKLAIVPSVSVAANPVVRVVGPAPTPTAALLTSLVVGGLLPTGIVYVAGLASTKARLSVAVNVNVAFPVNVGFGSKLRLEACAVVST